jgi:hypothetical protein
MRFILRHPRPRTLICAVNTPGELAELCAAGEGQYSREDDKLLEAYNRLQTLDQGVPIFLGALLTANLRQNHCGLQNLARVLGEKLPAIPLNVPDSPARIHAEAQRLVALLPARGFGRYAAVDPQEIMGGAALAAQD